MSQKDLKHWSTTLYTNKAASDLAQIPLSGATLACFNRGASVSAASGTILASGGNTVTVDVYAKASLEVGNELQVGTTPAKTLIVTAVNSDTSIDVENTSLADFSLAIRDRLINKSKRIVLYYDSEGATVLNSLGLTTSDANGFAEFYTKDQFFDVVITKTGITSRMMLDEESGVSIQRDFINVINFPSLQDAINSLPPGNFGNGIRKLYLPSLYGPYMPPSAAGWIIDRPIHIYGDGRGVPYGVQVWTDFSGPNKSKDSIGFTIADGTNDVTITDLPIDVWGGDLPQTAHNGVGDAIRINNLVTGCNTLRFENLFIGYMGRSAIRCMGTQYINQLMLDRVTGYQSMGGPNFYFRTLTGCWELKGMSGSAWTIGVLLEDCGNGTIIGGEVGRFGDGATDVEREGHYVLRRCADVTLTGVNIEHTSYYVSGSPPYPALTVKNGLVIQDCTGIVVQGCEFDNSRQASNLNGRAIYLRTDGIAPYDNQCMGNIIQGNTFFDVDKAVETQDHASVLSNFIGVQGLRYGDANGRGKIIISSRNVGYLHNMTDGAGGVGVARAVVAMKWPVVVGGTANIDSYLLQNGISFYDSTNHRYYFYIGGAWKYIDAADMH